MGCYYEYAVVAMKVHGPLGGVIRIVVVATRCAWRAAALYPNSRSVNIPNYP